MSLPKPFPYFQPDAADLARAERIQIQVYRLLTLLGAVLIPAFGLVRAFSSMPEAADPMWIRLAFSGLLVALFAASYSWAYVRRTYGKWLHGLSYVMNAWIVLLTAINQFTGDYSVSVLLMFTVQAGMIGFQTRRVGPVMWYTGFVILVTGGGVFFGPSPSTSPLILIVSIGSVAAIESVIVLWGTSAQETIRRQGERLQTITKNVSDGIYRSTPENGLVYANQAFAEMFGYESIEDLLTVAPVRLYADPGVRAELHEQVKEQGSLPPTEVEFRRKDGSTFTGLLCESVVWDEDGTVQYHDGTLVDITERNQRERELARRKALLEAQAEATIDGLLVVDDDRNVAFYNEQFLEVWDLSKSVFEQGPGGKTSDDDLVDYIADFVDDSEEFREKIAYLYDHPGEESRDLIQLSDGRWLDRYSAPILGDNAFYFGRLWVYRDVAEQKRREQKLEYRVTHDELTGLPNRTALFNEAQDLVEGPNDDTISGLLYLDLDHFKRINDNLGHAIGDELLVRVAGRLRETVRDADLAARLGGDEFGVCLPDVNKEEMVYQVAERIYEKLSTPYQLDGQELYIPASVGVVTGLSRYDSVEDALRDADAAMYKAKTVHKAKEQVRQPFVVFGDALPREVEEDFSINGK